MNHPSVSDGYDGGPTDKKPRRNINKEIEDLKAENEVLQEMYSELRMECGEWVKIKKGGKLPAAGEKVLWAFPDGSMYWDAVDENGWPYIHGLHKATHYRKIMSQKDCQYIYDMK